MSSVEGVTPLSNEEYNAETPKYKKVQHYFLNSEIKHIGYGKNYLGTLCFQFSNPSSKLQNNRNMSVLWIF